MIQTEKYDLLHEFTSLRTIIPSTLHKDARFIVMWVDDRLLTIMRYSYNN